MLHLIPPPLHRQLYRLAHAARCRWFELRGGTVHGCSIIARDGAGRVLLVRHSYGPSGWELPGGGVRRGEPAEATARREFAEELGCQLTGLAHLGQIAEPFHGAVNVVEVFTGRIDGEPRADGREILEVRFFDLEGLPVAAGGRTARRIGFLPRG